MSGGDFAKLYRFEDIGQVLVVLDQNDECDPCVRFSVMPDDLGICSLAPSWPEEEGGWDKAQKCFNDVTEESAYKMGKRILSSVTQFLE